MSTMNKIGFRQVLAYSLLPGIIPRTRRLVGSGLGPIALFVALVFRAARLLPDGHPYLNPGNAGRFSTIQVMTEAARHIWYNRHVLGVKNIDQVIIYGVIVVALALLVMQFVTLILALIVPSAMAFSFPGGASFPTPFHMFDTPSLQQLGVRTLDTTKSQAFYDVSFMFLDRVFGVKGIFNSCISDGVANSCMGIGPGGLTTENTIRPHDPGTFPWPFHHAFHGILQFYSIGLLVVAVFMLVYFAMVVVIETAQTGTPLGKRFNPVWAPLRLVLAAGLLIPISSGLNAGQYIVLYSAKWGANFASNGWIGFNQTIGQATILGNANDLIAKPQAPDPTALLHFMTVMQACKTIEDKVLLPQTKSIQEITAPGAPPMTIQPYLVKARAKNNGDVFVQLTRDMKYEEAVKWADGGDVIIRFGVQDREAYKDQKGTVQPFCGELTIPTVISPITQNTPGYNPREVAYTHEGAAHMLQRYWEMTLQLIFARGGGEGYASIAGGPSLGWNVHQKFAMPYVNMYVMKATGRDVVEPTPAVRDELGKRFKDTLKKIIDESIRKEQQNPTNPYKMQADLLARGWMAAGVWYNRIAEMNGGFTTAAWNLAKPTQYPDTMTAVAVQKQQANIKTTAADVFNPFVQNAVGKFKLSREGPEMDAAHAYWGITKWWQNQGTNITDSGTRSLQGGNPILDLINFMFGTSGLFSIRDNANVHPMAQLSSIGRALIERSVSLLSIGVLGAFAQPWMTGQFAGLKQAVEVVSGFAFSFLSIGASAGFILYYVIPFLPFIYFFFAAAGWVKALFEAMVGVPLWALAHIRIDGSGLPGDAAMGGYYLILEIIFRPILIVFGLISSVVIYAASVQVLNDIFNVAVANVAGVDITATQNNAQVNLENIRGSIDVFFYTILYTVLVYMVGMSCFKLIDLIPTSFGRWLGASINPLTDSGQSQAGTLVGYGTMGSQIAFGQLAGAAQKGASGISEVVKSTADSAGKK